MPAYWVARSRIIDPVEYKKYTDRIPAIFAKYGGRVLARGGHLVLTTHGWTALAYDARNARRPLAECVEIERALSREGHWFIDPFGEAGDWGVVNPLWGSAFVTADFLSEQLCPLWRVVEFVPGRNQHNQDVYVLARA